MIKIHSRVKSIENILFNKRQKILNKLSRWNYLWESEFTSSESQEPDVGKLLGYKVSGTLDQRLFNNIEFKKKKIKEKAKDD